MSTIKVNKLTTVGGAALLPSKGWADYSMNPTALINDSEGVSSIADLGPGHVQFTLTNALPAARGSTTNSCGLYSNATWPAVQSSSRVETTTTWQAKLGGDTSGAQDWQRGSTSVIG